MNNKKLELQFIPFNSEIIGADNEHVFLMESDVDEKKYFILKIDKKLYLECCDACGLVIDRDMNASLNIEAEGLRLHELMLTG